MTQLPIKVIRSEAFEAEGESGDGVDFNWIAGKFHRTASFMYGESRREKILAILSGSLDVRMRDIIACINES